MKLNRGLACLLIAASVVFGSGTLRADELDALHARILREPANSELNLRFAQLAEARGTLRWALAAYERILINDPDNFDAKLGMMRVRRALQPSFTMVTAEIGTGYESNPMYYLPGGKSAWFGQGSLSLRDERHLAGQRWRTNALIAGQVYSKDGDLNYAYAGGETGPVYDLWPGLSVAPALGAAAAYFDNRFYYGEASGSLTFEGTHEGAYRALRLRAAYRDYNDFFPSQHGWYADARLRLSQPDVLGAGSVVIFSPWVLWSDISGAVVNALVTEIQPGAYTEWGGRLEAFKTLTPWLTVGASFAIAGRKYREDVVVSTGAKRHDTTLIPGVTAVFPGFFNKQADLRLDYRFIRNNSNDPTKEFNDHIVSATAVTRFDPTLPNWGR